MDKIHFQIKVLYTFRIVSEFKLHCPNYIYVLSPHDGILVDQQV